ncbi:MAG: cyanophycin synthetase, partial [Bacteroidales bacterium]|nr:cyanophycin synthetase [Bacteroidales bacterium]
HHKLTAVFQPHLYSRTRDFATGFATSLDLSDECFLLDIYPAREQPIEGVTSAIIKNRIRHQQVQIVSKSELCEAVAQAHPQVVLMMGAGDIDRLVPIMKEKLLSLTR